MIAIPMAMRSSWTLGRQLESEREAFSVLTRYFWTSRETSHWARGLLATVTSCDVDAVESLRLM